MRASYQSHRTRPLGCGFSHAEFNLGAHETLDGRGWVKVVPNRARALGCHTMWLRGDDMRHDTCVVVHVARPEVN